MSLRSGHSNTTTKRALAVAIGVILLVVFAVLLRRDPAEVAIAEAPRVRATPRVEPTPAPTASPVASPRRPAPPAAKTPPPFEPPPPGDDGITFHVHATIASGCEIPADAKVLFLQTAPNVPPRVQAIPLAEVSDADGFHMFWESDANAVVVAIEANGSAFPGIRLNRKFVDQLPRVAHDVDPPVQGESIEGSVLWTEERLYAYREIKHDSLARAKVPGEERSISVTMDGVCASSIIVEMPPGVPQSLIEEVEVFAPDYAPRRYIAMGGMQRGALGDFVDAGFPKPTIVDRAKSEFRISPLAQGEYILRLRTTDSQRWQSEPIELAQGETRRVRVELEQGALVRARVVGADPSAESILYCLEGIVPPHNYAFHASLGSQRQSTSGGVEVKYKTGRPEDVVEFPGLQPGSFSIRAHDYISVAGAVSFALTRGEARDVVISLAHMIPVTVEVVGADRAPVSGGEFFYVTAHAIGLGKAESYSAKITEGIALLEILPGSYRFTAQDPMTRVRCETSGTVAGPGDGDHVVLVFETPMRVQGKVVDPTGKGLSGVVICANENSRIHSQRGRSGRSIISNEAGEFEIDLPPGDVRLFTYWNQLEAVHDVRMPIQAGEKIILRRDDITFRGVVLDAQTREPIAGATVRAMNIAGTAYSEDPGVMNQAMLVAPEATKDARGEFAITGLNSAKFQVLAFKHGVGSSEFLTELRSQDDPPTEILLAQNQTTLSGNVTDEEGRPIQGFRLRGVQRPGEDVLTILPSVETNNAGDYEARSIPAGDDLVILFEHQSTGEDGRYFLAHLAEHITLRPGEKTTYDFVAISAARLVVQVTMPDGMPARGAAIRLTQNGEQVFDQGRLIPGPTTTDRDGRLLFRAIPPGTYTARATLADGRTIEGTTTLDAWQYKTLTLRVE